MSNIYLVGMMGSGKTETGKCLARMAGSHFVDLDQRIEEDAGTAIAKIFEEKGEPYFRTLETGVLREVVGEELQVVATGGGIVLKPENVHLMQETGRIIFLDASAETLFNRIRGCSNRPLLQTADPRKSLEELLEKRISLYKQSCDVRILTDEKTPDQVAAEIAEKLKGSL